MTIKARMQESLKQREQRIGYASSGDNWPTLRYMENENTKIEDEMPTKEHKNVVECNCTCNSEEMRDAISGLTAALKENTDVYIGMLEAIRVSEQIDPSPEEVDNDDDKVAAV